MKEQINASAKTRKATMSARVIRADGTIEDLGVVSKSHLSPWERIKNRFSGPKKQMGKVTMSEGPNVRAFPGIETLQKQIKEATSNLPEIEGKKIVGIASVSVSEDEGTLLVCRLEDGSTETIPMSALKDSGQEDGDK